MTAADICLIIDTCAKAKVSSIQIGDLRLEFGEVEPAKPAVTPLRATEPTPPTDAALSDMQHATQNQEALEIDEARIKEDRLKHMLIENPLGAEELILSGELEDEEEGEDADE